MASLTTACPHCATQFYITSEQLAARGGRVRCGNCHETFDGDAHLLANEVIADAAPMHSAADPMDGAATNGAAPPEAATSVAPLNAFEPQFRQRAEGMHIAEAPNADFSDETASAALPAPRTPLLTLTAIKRALPFLSGVLILALLSLMVVQSLVVSRNWWISHYPQTRPLLTSLCAPFKCRVQPLAEPDQLLIESSDLAKDAAHVGLLTLTATLRSHAVHAIAYPMFEVTFNDGEGKIVARKVILPSVYLPQGTVADRGIPAGDELLLKLYLDIGSLPADGYKIVLFYE